METAPTLLTKSTQPSQQLILTDQRKPSSHFPGTLEPSVQSFEDIRDKKISPDRHSMSRTPPKLYQPPSADSIVRDFAYARGRAGKAQAARKFGKTHGSAAEYYDDTGQSVESQPGVRPSVSAPLEINKPLPSPPSGDKIPWSAATKDIEIPSRPRQKTPLQRFEPAPLQTIPPRISSRSWKKLPDYETPARHRRPRHHRTHLSDLFESTYYYERPKDQKREVPSPDDKQRNGSMVTDTRYGTNLEKRGTLSKSTMRYSGPTTFLQRNFSLRHPRRKHISLNEGQGFSLGRYHRRQPIAREWSTSRKRITAAIACLNTVFVGLIAGIYVGARGHL